MEFRDKEKILDELKDITENESLTLTSNFKEENVSSADLMELCWYIEDNYDIYLEITEIQKFNTIEDICARISQNEIG